MKPLLITLGFFIFVAPMTWAQDSKKAHIKQPGHESVSQGPAKKPARDDLKARSPGARIFRGPYMSVQVNVDPFGQNIRGDAANEPSIALDPNDPSKLVIGWRQFDNISSNFRQAGLGYSHNSGQSWIFPGVLTPGTFRSDPVLDFDADGTFYYFSLQGNFTCDMFISKDHGVTWQGPYPAWGGDKNWMGIDRTNGFGRGHIYCTWTGTNNFTRSTDGGLTYMNPIPAQAYWNTISVGPDGKVYVCARLGGNDYFVQRSSNAQNAGVTPTFDSLATVDLNGGISFSQGPNPGGLLGQLWVATNHSKGPLYNEVYLLASVNPPGSDPLDVYFARSTDQGKTWSNPIRVNDDPVGANAWQWFGTMSVAPNGRIDVIWNDSRNTGQDNLAELFYAYSHDGGRSWSKNIQVTPAWNSHIGWPQQNKIGDYYDMVSTNDGGHLAYAATFNNEQDVYYVKVFPELPLSADTYVLPAGGGNVNFALEGGQGNKNRTYLLLGGLSGSDPGTPLPGGLVTLPLNWDLFTNMVIKLLNTTVFHQFYGALDGKGMGLAQLNAPSAAGFIGVTMTYAYALDNPWDFVSNPVAIEIVP